LRVGRQFAALYHRVHAQRAADVVVERHQREAEAEHQYGDDRQPRQHAVVVESALGGHSLMNQYLAMMRTKVVMATAPSSKAVLRLRLKRVYLTTGGVSNEWYGAGVGRCVHSRESAPSQTLSGAFSPLRIPFSMM